MKKLSITALLAMFLLLASLSHANLYWTDEEYEAFIFGDMATRPSDPLCSIERGSNISMNSFCYDRYADPAEHNSGDIAPIDGQTVSGKEAGSESTDSTKNKADNKERAQVKDIAAGASLLSLPADVLSRSGDMDAALIADSVKRTGRSVSYGFDKYPSSSLAPEHAKISFFLRGTTVLVGIKKRI